MAAKSVSHTATMSVGNVSLAFSDTTTSSADPTGYTVGTQQVADAGEFIGGSASAATLAEIDGAACNGLLLLRNDNAVPTSNHDRHQLNVSLNHSSDGYRIVIKPQHTNIISVEDLALIKAKGGGSGQTVDFTYMFVQIDATT